MAAGVVEGAVAGWAVTGWEVVREAEGWVVAG